MRPRIPTNTQVVRAERTLAFLHARGIKRLDAGLFAEDDERLRPREPIEVARRAVALWQVVRVADGSPRPEAIEAIERLGLHEAATALERQFLRVEPIRVEEAERWRWRGEALFVLLWALGRVEKLGWPDRRRAPSELGLIVGPTTPGRALLDAPTARPAADLLDAQDLFLRLYRFVREEASRGRALPRNLIFEVVRERHLAINWLVRSRDQDWDDVTPS